MTCHSAPVIQPVIRPSLKVSFRPGRSKMISFGPKPGQGSVAGRSQESVIPTGAQRSGGICFSTETVGVGREADFSTTPLTIKL